MEKLLETSPVGVVGAGTMGTGIAQIFAIAGRRVLLHDADPVAAGRAVERIDDALSRDVRNGRTNAASVTAALDRIATVTTLADLADADLIVESIVEDRAAKRDLISRLEDQCSPSTVLATNTSSLSVTELASVLSRPERLVGLHFFNPVAASATVEVAAGALSSEDAVTSACAAARQAGKEPVVVRDGPGLLVNRCNRPFTLEGLRCLDERLVTVDELDRLYQEAAGFPLGPRRFIAVVGAATSAAIADGFFEQGRQLPRWRPSPTLRRWAAAEVPVARDVEATEQIPGAAPITCVLGHGPRAAALRALVDHRDVPQVDDPIRAELAIDCRPRQRQVALPRPTLVQVGDPMRRMRPKMDLGFFSATTDQRPAAALELCCFGSAPDQLRNLGERFATAVGMRPVWVRPSPGLVTGRVLAQLINEACFALDEGIVEDPDVIDQAMCRALRHPVGPFERLRELGSEFVVEVLSGLRNRSGDAYLTAPELLATSS